MVYITPLTKEIHVRCKWKMEEKIHVKVFKISKPYFVRRVEFQQDTIACKTSV